MSSRVRDAHARTPYIFLEVTSANEISAWGQKIIPIPRTQYFVFITAATAAVLRELTPFTAVTVVYRGFAAVLLRFCRGLTAVSYANFRTAVPITAATVVKVRTRSPVFRGFCSGNPAVTAFGYNVQVFNRHLSLPRVIRKFQAVLVSHVRIRVIPMSQEV